MTDRPTPLVAVPPGWMLVPIDPTPQMLAAVWRRFDLRGSGSTPAFKEAYKTMCAAAPKIGEPT